MTPEPNNGLQLGPIGLPRRSTAVKATITTLGLLLLLTAIALQRGEIDIPLSRMLDTFLGRGTRLDHLVLIDHRLARLLVGAGIGCALGIAGALTQTIARNPIATPDILGVTTGASAFAVLVLVMPRLAESTLGISGRAALIPGAFVGAFLTTALILGISWRGGFDGYRLILVGLGVNALALAFTTWLLTKASIEEAAVATRWLSGSLEGVTITDIIPLFVTSLVIIFVCLFISGDLGALKLGRDVAKTLGVRTGRTEFIALALAVLAVAVTTAIAGPIAFVAFVAPQAAMRVFGSAGPPPIASGLLGAVLLVSADLFAMSLPVTLPVGVITAIFGAPFLLYILRHQHRRTRA